MRSVAREYSARFAPSPLTPAVKLSTLFGHRLSERGCGDFDTLKSMNKRAERSLSRLLFDVQFIRSIGYSA